MRRPLSIALSLLLAACGVATMDSAIVGTHRLIEPGRYVYSFEDKIVETYEFQSDGQGRLITQPYPPDSVVWLFEWNTVDWSDGRLRLMTRMYLRQVNQNREKFNTTVYTDLKDVTESSISLCSSDRGTCASPVPTVWRVYRREN